MYKAKRFKFNIAQQFAIIPTFGIVWGDYDWDWKFGIAFI